MSTSDYDFPDVPEVPAEPEDENPDELVGEEVDDPTEAGDE